MISDWVKIAYLNVKSRKLRTTLTVLGIVIAITAIVSLLLLSSGLQNAIKEEFDKIGTNRIFLAAEGGFTSNQHTPGLTEKDLDQVKKVAGVKEVMAYYVSTEEVEYSREKNIITVRGVEPELMEDIFPNSLSLDIEEGRYLKRGDKFNVVLGWAAANTAYNKKVGLQKNIKMFDEKFKVVGIVEKLGNDADDRVIYMDIDTMRDISDGDEDVTFADIIVQPGLDPLVVGQSIDRRLDRFRGSDDYSLLTPDQALEQANNVLGIIQVVIVGIAVISLLVGSVGITNSMYTAVSERSGEIGIMKSIGAKNSDIWKIFLYESIIIGLIGGVLGTLLGLGIALLLEYVVGIVSPVPIKIIIDYNLLAGSVIFAAVFAIISGVSPAIQAANLNPVEALRK